MIFFLGGVGGICVRLDIVSIKVPKERSEEKYRKKQKRVIEREN